MFKKLDKEFHIKYGTVLTIVIITAVVIWGAWRHNTNKEIPLENAPEVYNQAISRLFAIEDVYYKVSGTKKISADGNSTEETFTQLITYENQGTKDFRGCVEEDTKIGTHSIKSFEFFTNGVAYFTTQGASFQAEMSADEYTARYTPAVTFDTALYAEITGFAKAKTKTIFFSKPGAAESWIGENGIALISAKATATINQAGDLTHNIYEITYAKDKAVVSLQIAVEILYSSCPPIHLPDSSAYTPISDINVPKMLERSYGYLTTAQNIQSQYSDTIYCEAFGDERTQTVKLSTSMSDSWSAKVDSTISISNSSKVGMISTSTKKEVFENGAYTYSIDNGTASPDDSVNEETMRSYCGDLLSKTIPLPDDIASVEVTETDEGYYIVFHPKDDYANFLAQDACQTLYQNPSILIDQALSYNTENVSCYLNVDKLTGYPVSFGFHYSGKYVIGGIPYQLSYKADQIYLFTSEAFEEETTEPTEYTEAQETEVS